MRWSLWICSSVTESTSVTMTTFLKLCEMWDMLISQHELVQAYSDIRMCVSAQHAHMPGLFITKNDHEGSNQELLLARLIVNLRNPFLQLGIVKKWIMLALKANTVEVLQTGRITQFCVACHLRLPEPGLTMDIPGIRGVWPRSLPALCSTQPQRTVCCPPSINKQQICADRITSRGSL